MAPMLTTGCAPLLETPACRKLCWPGASVCSPGILRYSRKSLKRSQSFPRKYKCASILQYEVSEGIASLSNVFRVTEGIAILTAITYTALPLLSARRTYEVTPADEDLSADEVRWGVMTVVSCLPLFNWLAWVFAALESEESAGLYYSLALLYGLPQLSAGFQQDWFSIATLIAGAVHVQLVRLSEERGMKQGNFKVDDGLRTAPARASKLLGDKAKAFSDAIQTREQDNEGTASNSISKQGEEDFIAEELEQWDARLKERDKDKANDTKY